MYVYGIPGIPRHLAGQHLLGLFALGLRGLWYGLGQQRAHPILKLFTEIIYRNCLQRVQVAEKPLRKDV